MSAVLGSLVVVFSGVPPCVGYSVELVQGMASRVSSIPLAPFWVALLSFTSDIGWGR